MKKSIIPFLFVILFLIGCTPSPQPVEPSQSNSLPTGPNTSLLEEDKIPSIGGISLNDSTEKVTNILGSEFTVKDIEEGGYFGEPYYERTYNNGMKLIIGKDSGKVLQIMSTSVNTPTEMGVKIGDASSLVLQQYRAKYTEPVSLHGAGTLEGWFEVGDGQLLIFDFDASDDTMVNQKIEPDSKVERLILAYSKFMD